MKKIRPSEQAILKQILDIATHSWHAEYYLKEFQLDPKDPDRPHDMVNKGNKLEWEALGMALYHEENGEELYKQQILTARQYHRQQHHHQIWNKYNPKATEDGMKFGAVDAICSRLEDRGYQGGRYTIKEIEEIAGKNPIYQIPWMRLIISEMKKIERPDLTVITSFSKIPRKGVSPETYDTIMERVDETLKELKKDHGYKFNSQKLYK